MQHPALQIFWLLEIYASDIPYKDSNNKTQLYLLYYMILSSYNYTSNGCSVIFFWGDS